MDPNKAFTGFHWDTAFPTLILQVVNTHNPGKKVWLGGLGPAWAGGISNLSDTYAAGFLWVPSDHEKLWSALDDDDKRGVKPAARDYFHICLLKREASHSSVTLKGIYCRTAHVACVFLFTPAGWTRWGWPPCMGSTWSCVTRSSTTDTRTSWTSTLTLCR